MPADPLRLLTPGDRKVMNEAGRRGERQLWRVVDAIVRRITRTDAERERLREQLMAGDVDNTWPPMFLRDDDAKR